MTAEVELKVIQKELKTMNQRLAFIEDLVGEVIVRDLLKAKASKREVGEINKAISEMKRGRRMILEERSA